MNWNQHRLPQDHALLSASKYHWLNYDDRAMVEALRRAEAAARVPQQALEALNLTLAGRDHGGG